MVNISHILICDDVRVEREGKLTIIGLLPSNRYLVEEDGERVARFNILIMLKSEGEGEQQIRIEANLFSPSGKPLMSEDNILEAPIMAEDTLGVGIIVIEGLKVDTNGRYKLTLKQSDYDIDEEFMFEFYTREQPDSGPENSDAKEMDS